MPTHVVLSQIEKAFQVRDFIHGLARSLYLWLCRTHYRSDLSGQDRSYESDLSGQGRSYESDLSGQGRSYESDLSGQDRSYESDLSGQGRSYGSDLLGQDKPAMIPFIRNNIQSMENWQ